MATMVTRTRLSVTLYYTACFFFGRRVQNLADTGLSVAEAQCSSDHGRTMELLDCKSVQRESNCVCSAGSSLLGVFTKQKKTTFSRNRVHPPICLAARLSACLSACLPVSVTEYQRLIRVSNFQQICCRISLKIVQQSEFWENRFVESFTSFKGVSGFLSVLSIIRERVG
jgi:hypothetical protein